MPTSPPRSSPLVVGLVAAVATWLASVLANALGVGLTDLYTLGEVVVFAMATTVLPGIVAVTTTGFLAANRDRRHETPVVTAVAVGSGAYLGLTAVATLLQGAVEAGVAMLAGALIGPAIGAGLALLLLGRSERTGHRQPT